MRQLQFGWYWVTEELRGVLPRDLAHFVGGEVGETRERPALRVGPGRVGVRVVALQRDVVDADVLAQAGELLTQPPSIERLEVIAAKLPNR